MEVSTFQEIKLTSIFRCSKSEFNKNSEPNKLYLHEILYKIEIMLKQTINCVKYRIVPIHIRSRSTKVEPKTNTDGNCWDLLVGVQIERLPIVSKTLTKLERDYQVCVNSA